MSIKSLRKRIALVAVAALTSSLIAVVGTPSANATEGYADGTILVYGAGATGVCGMTDASAGLTSNVTQYTDALSNPIYVTMAIGGTLPFAVAGGTATYLTYTSGPAVTAALGTTAGSFTLHDQYGIWSTSTGATGSQSLTAAAVGTTTLKSYTTTAPFSALNTPSTSVAKRQVVIDVVASCSSTTAYSSADSGINVSTVWDDSPAFTDGDVLTFGAGSRAYINMDLYNGYGAALPSTTSLAVSATNGALVKIGTDATIDDSTTSDGTTSAASTTTDGEDISIRVTPASRAAGGTTVVTVTAAGVVVATRTITFLPEATTINVVKLVTGPVGGEGAIVYTLSNGSTVVPGSVSGLASTYTNRVSSVTNIKGGTITAEDADGAGNATESSTATRWSTALTGVQDGTTTYGVAEFACASGGGTGSTTVTIRHLLPVSATYITKDVALSCAGGINTYTVSMDKASYNIGDIAIMTIEAKDSTGAAVNDFAAVGTTDVTAGGGTLTKAAAAADAFSGGKRTYTVQMTTAGTFNAVVNISGITTKTATARYTVNAAAGVTNAEVLAAIVKLIASINKQIKALQKSLKR